MSGGPWGMSQRVLVQVERALWSLTQLRIVRPSMSGYYQIPCACGRTCFVNASLTPDHLVVTSSDVSLKLMECR